jgi:PTS system mannose-specific IIA component
VSIGWHEDVDLAREEIGRGIERVREKVSTPEATGGVLVLTDMFGGTPANLGVTFLETDKVEVITGLNLAMLMKLARPLKDTDLLTLARDMREHGRNAIWVASDLIRGEKS